MKKEKKRTYDKSIVKYAMRRPLRGGGWPADLPVGTMIRVERRQGESIPGNRLYGKPLDRQGLWSAVKKKFAIADVVSHSVVYVLIALTSAFAYVGISVVLSACFAGGSNG